MFAALSYDTFGLTADLAKVYDEASNLTDDEWGEIGALVVLEIDARTTDGIDAFDQQFDEYSEGYADYRVSHGRLVGHVDLQFEGIMLGAMTSRTMKNAVKIYFNNLAAGKVAFYHNADSSDETAGGFKKRSKIPLRRFLDVAPDSDLDFLIHETAQIMISDRINLIKLK